MDGPSFRWRFAFAFLGALAIATPGCGSRGTVTFIINAPARAELSPFADPRHTTVTLLDEITSHVLGQPLNTPTSTSPPGMSLAIGDIPDGHYDLRMLVSGSSQLLGLARTPSVDISRGDDIKVTLEARKPIAFYGASELFGGGGDLPLPAPINAFDTTVSGIASIANVAPLLDPHAQVIATATSHEGLHLVAAGTLAVAVLDTRDMKPLSLANLSPAPNQTSAPIPRGLTISPDDRFFAVATDQGVVIGDLVAFVNRQVPTSLPIVPLANVLSAEFSADGKTLTVLTGQRWQDVDCSQTRAATIYDISVDAPVVPSGRPAPFATTDLAYHPTEGLLLALPCGAGVVRESDRRVVIAGQRIFDFNVNGTRTIAVEGVFEQKLVAYDPADPSHRNIMVSFGQMHVASGGAVTTTSFRIPTYSPGLVVPNFGLENGQTTTPLELAAWSLSVTPDGAAAVLAYRVRYDIKKHYETYRFGLLNYYCDLIALRDVYYVTKMELAAGTIYLPDLYATGIAEPRPCATQCYDCPSANTCKPTNYPPAPSCSFADGFAPDGISILMGNAND